MGLCRLNVRNSGVGVMCVCTILVAVMGCGCVCEDSLVFCVSTPACGEASGEIHRGKTAVACTKEVTNYGVGKRWRAEKGQPGKVDSTEQAGRSLVLVHVCWGVGCSVNDVWTTVRVCEAAR